MRELNVNEIEQVSGGLHPIIPFTAGVLAEAICKGYTGKGMADHLAPAFKPISPHDAYYHGNMYISP